MNTRVSELLKNPKNIQSDDLAVLKEEISSFPYVQNIRALYLYGVHLHDRENYQRELSTTAAYTTDKKILYQLINGKIQQKPKPEITKEKAADSSEKSSKYSYQTQSFPIKREEKPIEDIQKESEKRYTAAHLQPVPKPEIQHIYVDGERNRILFEGEENFLTEDTYEVIDLESTLESGSIITQKPQVSKEKQLGSDQNDTPEISSHEPGTEDVEAKGVNFTSETVIEKDNLPTEIEEKVINDQNQKSFQEIEAFHPDVTVGNTESEQEEDNQEEIIADLVPANKEIEAKGIDFTSETVIEKNELPTEVEEKVVNDQNQKSFQEIEAFHPDITVENTESQQKEDNQEEIITESASEGVEFTPEVIINEDKIHTEEQKEPVQNDAELSFHGMESFLPEVKIQANNAEESENAEISQSANSSKHEDEMRRLIEEVEKKMKEKASRETETEKEPENISSDISFAETQSFEVVSSPLNSKESEKEISDATVQAEKTEASPKDKPADEINTKDSEEAVEERSSWKPMSFESNLPDSLINKPVEIQEEIKPAISSEDRAEIKITEPEIDLQAEILANVEDIPNLEKDNSQEFGNSSEKLIIDEQTPKINDENEDDRVMNVSFFGSGWTIASPEKKEEKKEESEDIQEAAEEKKEEVSAVKTNPIDSNVPGFINTWQSWLKIDRKEEAEKEKAEIKIKAIEAFIETNPKISQLKDESSYVVKERNDDISHLMTETLASLYFEQKLYTKAIKSFEILIKKNPQKKEYFERKIQEIKDFRTKGN